MILKFLKLFEEFEEGKFELDDIKDCIKNDKGIYATIVDDYPENSPDEKLKVVDVDYDSGKITVTTEKGIKYVELKNVERIEQ